MNIGKNQIGDHNESLQAAHQQRLEYAMGQCRDAEAILDKLAAFQVAVPSWALGSGGTRFGRFSIGGE